MKTSKVSITLYEEKNPNFFIKCKISFRENKTGPKESFEIIFF